MKKVESPKVRCMYDHIITSMNTRLMTTGGLIVTDKQKGEILTRQTVLVAGPNAGVEVGDEIEINVDRFPRKNIGPKQVGAVNDIGPDRMVVVPPVEIIDEKEYLLISSREIKYIYTK